jgi:hypothetical protein
LLTIEGKPSLYLDDDGELLIFDGDNFGALGEIPVRRYKLAGPDHLHLVETDDSLYVGHLMKGFVQIIDKETGEEMQRIEGCPILYGATMDEASGRMFFSCQQDLLVVGSRGDELNKVLGRVPYPGKQRIGPFLHGRDRVLWGYTESAIPELQRLDLTKEPYVMEALPVEASLQQFTSRPGIP